MLSTAYQYKGPAAVRYPRGSGPGTATDDSLDTLPIGKAFITREGSRIAILAFGSRHAAAQQAGDAIDATVVNMRFVKPLDTDMIMAIAAGHELLVTVEENVLQGGAGSAVNEVLHANNAQNRVINLGIPDAFIEHGDHGQQLSACGLDTAGILAAIRSAAKSTAPASATLPPGQQLNG